MRHDGAPTPNPSSEGADHPLSQDFSEALAFTK